MRKLLLRLPWRTVDKNLVPIFEGLTDSLNNRYGHLQQLDTGGKFFLP